MRITNGFLIALCLCSGITSALTVTVAPTTGVPGTAVTNSIADAFTQINAGADTANSIVLRSTEGVHAQAANSIWALTAGKSVNFTAESGQPIVLLQWTTGRYMLTINAGVNGNNPTSTFTFTGIAFIPQTGLVYGNNVADGLSLISGNFVFNNCVFSNNNGSNAVASQEGNVPYTGTGFVGDDWIQSDSAGDLTFSNCTITGAFDDAVVFAGAIAPEVADLRFDTGTCIANNGGAGIQVFGTQSALICDGTNGRVLVADNGKRASTNDTGIKFFADTGCSIALNKTDVVGHNNGGIFDFDGVPSISITESRIAFNNSADVATAANLAIAPTDTDNAATIQNILLDNVTVHDTLATNNADSIFAAEGVNNPRQVFTIVDGIFSGAGDSFANMTNSTSSGGSSPAPAVTFSAVVNNGPHAIANAGDLGAGQVNADPAYVSTTYTVGRNQLNPTFLQPASPAYLTAGSGGTVLSGGAPLVSSVQDYMLY